MSYCLYVSHGIASITVSSSAGFSARLTTAPSVAELTPGDRRCSDPLDSGAAAGAVVGAAISAIVTYKVTTRQVTSAATIAFQDRTEL